MSFACIAKAWYNSGEDIADGAFKDLFDKYEQITIYLKISWYLWRENRSVFKILSEIYGGATLQKYSNSILLLSIFANDLQHRCLTGS